MQKPGEPYFLDSDSEAALEYFEEQSLLCSGCGLPRDETMDKDAQDAYEAHLFRCHACAARDRKARQHAKDGGDDAGALFAVERRD